MSESEKIDVKEKKEEQKGEQEYVLFVAFSEDDAVGELEDEEDEEEEEEEVELGSDDSEDEAEEEEYDRIAQSLQTLEWSEGVSEGIFGYQTASDVKEMSCKLYDHSDEGLREMADAMGGAIPTKKTNEEEGNRAAGMLVLCIRPGEAEITQLFVDPEYRDNHVGQKLVRCALRYLVCLKREKSVKTFAIGGSSSFYEKMGFRKPEKTGEKGKKRARTSVDAEDRVELVREILPDESFSDSEEEEEEEE